MKYKRRVPGKIIRIVMGREIISTHEYRNNYTHLTWHCLTGGMALLNYLIVTRKWGQINTLLFQETRRSSEIWETPQQLSTVHSWTHTELDRTRSTQLLRDGEEGTRLGEITRCQGWTWEREFLKPVTKGLFSSKQSHVKKIDSWPFCQLFCYSMWHNI